MPLIKGKSPEAFKHDLKAEMKAGKPMKQSLAIAYSMKKKAKKYAHGGSVSASEDRPHVEGVHRPAMFSKADSGQSMMGDAVRQGDLPRAKRIAYDKIKEQRPLGHRARLSEYADGGEVESDKHKKDVSDFAKGASESKPKEFSYIKNLKEGLGMDDGGPVKPKPSPEPENPVVSSLQKAFGVTQDEIASAKRHKYANGGFVDGNYQSDDYDNHQGPKPPAVHEQSSGFVFPEDVDMSDTEYAKSSEKLNQHGSKEVGPSGVDEPFHDGYSNLGSDIVDRIMAKRLNESGHPSHEYVQKYSEGGKVANATPITAGFKPAEFDDLVLRDDLESHYGDDDNAGDSLGNARLDHDNDDIVARIMRSRAKKDRLPRPA